jgi:hypothetical protein
LRPRLTTGLPFHEPSQYKGIWEKKSTLLGEKIYIGPRWPPGRSWARTRPTSWSSCPPSLRLAHQKRLEVRSRELVFHELCRRSRRPIARVGVDPALKNYSLWSSPTACPRCWCKQRSEAKHNEQRGLRTKCQQRRPIAGGVKSTWTPDVAGVGAAKTRMRVNNG